jgi:hypothetical protein
VSTNYVCKRQPSFFARSHLTPHLDSHFFALFKTSAAFLSATPSISRVQNGLVRLQAHTEVLAPSSTLSPRCSTTRVDLLAFSMRQGATFFGAGISFQQSLRYLYSGYEQPDACRIAIPKSNQVPPSPVFLELPRRRPLALLLSHRNNSHRTNHVRSERCHPSNPSRCACHASKLSAAEASTVTRTLMGATSVITLGTMLQLVNPGLVAYVEPLVFKKFELWRPFTAFFVGPRGLSFLFT